MRLGPSSLSGSFASIVVTVAALASTACDGSFTTPNGTPVPPSRDTTQPADTDTRAPDTTDTSSPRPTPADTTDTTQPHPSDTHTPDTSLPDTSDATDTRTDTGPNACDADTYLCGGSASDPTITWCDRGELQATSCATVCRDAGYTYTTGCGYDPTYDGDSCYCDNEAPPAPTCSVSACAATCAAQGREALGCGSGSCVCGALLPSQSCAPTGWECRGDDLSYCDGGTRDTWSCDDVCRDSGYAFASGCGYDASLGGDTCFCEDDACTAGEDLCLDADTIETCGSSGPVTWSCDAVCYDAGYDFSTGCGYDGSRQIDSCFCADAPCNGWEFQCNDGLCLDQAYTCDGIFDCSGGEDELGCF